MFSLNLFLFIHLLNVSIIYLLQVFFEFIYLYSFIECIYNLFMYLCIYLTIYKYKVVIFVCLSVCLLGCRIIIHLTELPPILDGKLGRSTGIFLFEHFKLSESTLIRKIYFPCKAGFPC